MKGLDLDLSPSFIDAAIYLTARCGLSDRVTFQVGDALHLPFDDAAFDAVFLQHVAMNVEDRASLYAEVRRIRYRKSEAFAPCPTHNFARNAP